MGVNFSFVLCMILWIVWFDLDVVVLSKGVLIKFGMIVCVFMFVCIYLWLSDLVMVCMLNLVVE